jgi:hypothetical protein
MLGVREFKASFFDKSAVLNATDKGSRTVLSKFGAYVQRKAKTSIRKRKRIASPGQPPSSHEGSLKRLIYFGYDAGRKSVVIGPARFGAGEAPAALEYGGVITIRSGKSKGKKGRVRARPFMHPAFDSELPQLPALWRNSIIR